MKKLIAVALAVAMVLTLAGTAVAAAPGLRGDENQTVDGDDLNGEHYNLNIIGVKNAKNANMDQAAGNVIFVNLSSPSKINLVESGTDDAPGTAADEFAVLDKNGTDGDGATFALPDPELDAYVVGDAGEADTITSYSIFVRPLGKPGGWTKITTCADVTESLLADFLSADDIDILNRAGAFGGVASIESTGQLVRQKGQSVFTNQTAALLTIVLQVNVDYEDDGVWDEVLYVRVPIFDAMLENEYWEYDNNGLKLLQVRIYRVATDVSQWDWSDNWEPIPLP